MNKLEIFFITVIVASFVLNANTNAQHGDMVQINKDVHSVRSGWANRNTDIDKVYERSRPLLKKYANNAPALARIYLVILESHAISDNRRHDEAIEYAKKTEKLPLSPTDKALLYRCWGDVVATRSHGGHADIFRNLRRKASVYYLMSMRVAVDQHLPMVLEKPKVPKGVNLSMSEHVVFNIPEDMPEAAKNELRKRKEDYEARQLAREEYWRSIERWKQDTLTLKHIRNAREHLGTLYTLKPRALTEIELLSSQVLQDRERITDLINRIRQLIELSTASKEQRINASVSTINSIFRKMKDRYNIVAKASYDRNEDQLLFAGTISEVLHGQHVTGISGMIPEGNIKREYRITCESHLGRQKHNVVRPEILVKHLQLAMMSSNSYDQVSVQFTNEQIRISGPAYKVMELKELFIVIDRKTTYSISNQVPELEFDITIPNPEADTIPSIEFQSTLNLVVPNQNIGIH
ncbi:MAG: hypothetical protein GY774_05375 [Planctomycetes bacterium]|nr:hypothetical protein [Planctomycetota bacterium]